MQHVLDIVLPRELSSKLDEQVKLDRLGVRCCRSMSLTVCFPQVAGAGSTAPDELASVAPGDADVASIQDLLEAETHQQLQLYIQLVKRFCHSAALLEASQSLQASALLAMCNFMCTSADTCDSCLQLLFSLLTKRCVSTVHVPTHCEYLKFS